MTVLAPANAPANPNVGPMACEICGQVLPFGRMKSISVFYNMPGKNIGGGQPTPFAPYGCPVQQHYGCSHEHAVLAVVACLMEHIQPGNHEQSNDQGNTVVHPTLNSLMAEIEALVPGPSNPGKTKS